VHCLTIGRMRSKDQSAQFFGCGRLLPTAAGPAGKLTICLGPACRQFHVAAGDGLNEIRHLVGGLLFLLERLSERRNIGSLSSSLRYLIRER
jgi:hypothetical protein